MLYSSIEVPDTDTQLNSNVEKLDTQLIHSRFVGAIALGPSDLGGNSLPKVCALSGLVGAIASDNRC